MNLAKWVQEVYLVQLELLEEEEGEASEVQLDLLDQWVNLVPLEEEVCLEMMVLQGQKVNLETEVCLDHWDQKENKETLEDLVHLVCKV